MNTAQYLQRQGWRGHGHSLDKANRGLARPLLVTHKSDSGGLGTKSNDFTDQWWLKAWDTTSDKKPTVAAPLPTTGLAIARNPSLLYARFVKAKPLEGTLSEQPKHTMAVNGELESASRLNGNSVPAAEGPEAAPAKSKKRKHADATDDVSPPKKEKKAKKKDKHTTEKVNSDSAQPSEAAPPMGFFVDTAGSQPQSAPVKEGKSSKQSERKTTLDAGNSPSKTAQTESTSTMHPDRAKLTNGTKVNKHTLSEAAAKSASAEARPSNYDSRPVIAPPRKKHKQAQTAHFPDPSLSITEMVKRYNEQAKIPGPDGKLPKRRAPRNIRKEARAAKQAYEDAKAAERGEKAAPVSIPMTKSERRYAKKKQPTERRLVKLERKKRKQDAARQGAAERKHIVEEAHRLVEEMKANGTMPDTSKPIEELLAEKQAELATSLEANKLREAGEKAVEKLKANGKMPLDKTENEVLDEQIQKIKDWREGMAQAKAEGKPWPPPKPGPDYSHVDLPELEVPKFRTVTLGIPIPGTKKRGSLKELRRALEEAGLTKLQQAAYIHKALQEKKEARAIKDKIKEERRKGRKAARGRKKLLRQQGLAEANRLRKQKEKEERFAKEQPEKAAKKAEKQKKKAHKAETLSHNTRIILEQREKEKRERGETVEAASKLEVKQARRMARKLVRLAKKSRLSREEVPEGFKLKRSQKLKLKGNGGRIPTWTAMDIAANIKSAREDAIKAAEKSNKDKMAKKQKPETDALASGAGYVPLD